ncbi:MAG: glycosyltransferase family 2 protein [Clostridiales bacterium]|nr:glycosyltransferase family 2 protein [Clostridiales bacterium]
MGQMMCALRSRTYHFLRRVYHALPMSDSTRRIAKKKFLKLMNREPVITPYGQWITENEPTEDALNMQKKHVFQTRPLISLVLPMTDMSADDFKELLHSIKAQTYESWELCIFNRNDTTNSEIANLCSSDQRIKYNHTSEDNMTGEYIGFLSYDDTLAPFALFEIVKAINEHQDIDFIYADEDKMNEHERYEPQFKPDFAPDTLRSTNYIGSFFVVSQAIANALTHEVAFAQDRYYELVLRVGEQASKVHHIAKILNHKRGNAHPSASPDPDSEAIQSHITKHLDLKSTVERTELDGVFNVVYEVIGNPKVSIVIPNKDHLELLKPCVDSILELTTYDNYEIVIVENNSVDEETFAYYRELELLPHIHVLRYPGTKFNYQKIINHGAKNCTGDYIMQLNNDTQILTPNWLELMLGFAQRSDVGVVGVKLYYPDMTIQHAGGIFVPGESFTEHIFVGIPKYAHGYMNRAFLIQNISWVTGACVLSRKEIYEQVGFMDEDYEIFYGDVDFCMKAKALGKTIIFHPFVELIHYEGKTRGNPLPPEKYRILQRDKDLFMSKWQKALEQGDPYYNPTIKKLWTYNSGTGML